MIVSPRSRASSMPAALVALVSILIFGAAATPSAAEAADEAARGKDGTRGKARAACIKRVSRSRGVSRRAARRICRHARHRRPAAPTAPEGNSGVSSAETPAAPAAPAAADARAVPAAATGCANADTAPAAANVAALRAAVLCLVNAQRAASGLGALVDNAALTAAAQGHSDEMVARRYFAHTSADGGDVAARLSAAGWAGATSGENIAWGGGALGTPAQIVASWMNSPGHKANILNGAFTSSGVGVASATPSGGGGGTYTHDFGG